jgi:glycopeptide antibiotics resistance protein
LQRILAKLAKEKPLAIQLCVLSYLCGFKKKFHAKLAKNLRKARKGKFMNQAPFSPWFEITITSSFLPKKNPV